MNNTRVRSVRSLVLLLLVSGFSAAWMGSTPGSAHAAMPSQTASKCAALTLQVRPGLNPALSGTKTPFSRIALDAPRSGMAVSIPLYLPAAPLTSFIASPFPEYPADPYLQSASVEYSTADGVSIVESWAAHTFPACGWHPGGTWNTNASEFASGTVWTSNGNPSLNVYVSLAERPDGGAYIGYGVEAIVLPQRPTRSYLHGPFKEIRLTVQRNVLVNGSFQPRISHHEIWSRPVIRRLVSAINGIKGRRTAFGFCSGGGPGPIGPIWLTFVRYNGTRVHAYDNGGGACGGGLAVNGVRWLTDSGTVWSELTRLAKRLG